jgi:hypothetical protein
VRLDYETYLDKLYGGWLGKCIGGTVGARFEGRKNIIEIAPDELFPDKIPPNDDLDLQVLWLKVLEQKGAALTSEDLADAWLDLCWYPFNEYGVFRRNWRCGIHPPTSGLFANPFWKTGMGCPIRSEIWGYVFPGDPDRAAHYARLDGTLDHGPQSVGAEQLFAAMAAMAFLEDDLRGLLHRFLHYLPDGSPVDRLTRLALQGLDAGLPLDDVRARILANAPCGEACDAQLNVPFTVLGLLAGEGDLVDTILRTLRCGYDTDCTLATTVAFLGQVLGAEAIPARLKDPIGDTLVMGIQYKRPDMRVSTLARDTARIGVLLSERGPLRIDGAPEVEPLPAAATAPDWRLAVEHIDAPGVAPGDTLRVRLRADGPLPAPAPVEITPPHGWEVLPARPVLTPEAPAVDLCLHLSRDVAEVPVANVFTTAAAGRTVRFGAMGAQLWRLLGVFFDTPTDLPDYARRRCTGDYVTDPDTEYLPPDADGDDAFTRMSAVLGRPAVIPARELMIDLTRLIPLDTVWCAYLERVFRTPEACEAWLCIGHDAPVRLWLDGEEIGRDEGRAAWMPETSHWRVALAPGEHRIRLRVDRTGHDVRLSCMMRVVNTERDWWLGSNDFDTESIEIAPS